MAAWYLDVAGLGRVSRVRLGTWPFGPAAAPLRRWPAPLVDGVRERVR